MKRILITGSNGFVGQNLIKKLKTDYEIYGLDRTETKQLDEGHSFVADIENFMVIDNIFRNNKFDILIHLAAIVHKNNVDTSKKNYDYVNYQCSKKLFDLCHKYNIMVIFSSTIEVYGETNLDYITEETDVHPMSYYAESKLKAENYLKSIDINFCILRLTPLYSNEFTLNIDKRTTLMDKKIAYYFRNGEYNFSFCSVDNVTCFISSIIEKDMFNNETYILSDNENVSVTEIIELFRKSKKIKLIIKFPYFICYLFVTLLDNINKFFDKKDNFLSKRNFMKLFTSIRYDNQKAKAIYDFPFNIYNSLYKEDSL